MKSEAKARICKYTEEIIEIHPPIEQNFEDCDTAVTSDKKIQLKEQIKKSVIDKVYKNVSSRLFKENTAKQNKTIIKKGPEVETNKNDKLLADDFESFLKITSFTPSTAITPPKKVHHPTLTVSKWLQDETQEFSSLPHFPNELATFRDIPSSAKHKQPKNHSKVSHVTLPPIKQTQSSSSSCFRSVSATPRCQNKSLSATSLQVGLLEGQTFLDQGMSQKKIQTRFVTMRK